MAGLHQRTWIKATSAGVVLILLTSGCTGLSNHLGQWQARSLIDRAPKPEQCNDNGPKPASPECEGAFHLGPLAQEIDNKNEFLEPPSPIIQIPASPDVRHVLGGRGEGLNCSIPPVLKELFFSPSQFDAPDRDPVAPLALQFAQACFAHDMCYRHGAATYGYTQRDCDEMLFDQSYRLCTSIYRVRRKGEGAPAAGSRAVDTCMAQAGAVYMGVARFGSGSYRQLGQSTFFEFDPMARAKRAPYTVSRVIRSDIGDNTPRLFHYRFGPENVAVREDHGIEREMRGAVTERLLQMPAPRPTTSVTSDSIHQHYLVAQRDKLSNTGTRLMMVPYGGSSIVQLRRNPADDKVEAFDCNTAMHLPVRYSGKTTLYTFGIASISDNQEKCPRTFLEDGVTVALKPQRLDELAYANYYRLQQLEPLLGRFEGSEEPQLLLLGRGYMHRRDSSPSQADRRQASSGENYEKMATAFRLSLENKLVGVDLISIPETALPIAPFRTDLRSQDALLSLHVPKESRHVHFSLWRLGKKTTGYSWTPIGPNPMGNLHPSWLDMPAQIVSGPGPDRVVFTRVELDGVPRSDCCSSNNDDLKRAGKARLQVQVFVMADEDKMQRVACASTVVAYPASAASEGKQMGGNVGKSPALSWLSAQAIPVQASATALKVFFVPHMRDHPDHIQESAVIEVSESSTCTL